MVFSVFALVNVTQSEYLKVNLEINIQVTFSYRKKPGLKCWGCSSTSSKKNCNLYWYCESNQEKATVCYLKVLAPWRQEYSALSGVFSLCCDIHIRKNRPISNCIAPNSHG